MSAQEMLVQHYTGKALEPREVAVGCTPLRSSDMICDCDGDGECCGN